MVTIIRASRDDAAQILALQRLAYQSEARLYQDGSLPPLTQSLSSSVSLVYLRKSNVPSPLT